MPIWFNGKCSTDLGILVEHRPVRQIAQRRLDRIPVPGASRDISQYQEDAGENVPQPYDIAIVPALRRSKDLPLYARKVMEWLHAPTDYVQLSDSYDPNMFRMAAYTATGEKIENMLAKFGRATITFDCDGRWFYQDGDVWEEVDLTDGLSFLNPTPYASRPLISITGHGKFGWRLVNTTAGLDLTYMFNVTGNTNRTIRVEAEKAGDAYRADNGANMNGVTTVTGSGPAGKVPIFPAAGTTVLTPVITETEGAADGVITQMWIKKRWYTV